VVCLDAGDAVSADARLIEARALSIEMAALTRESQPVGRTSESARGGTAAITAS
jgi:P-type Ca2+ transporter type 2C